jgi:hypothetical protein
VACDFEVAVEIHDGVTATILGDLNDIANGLSVGVPIDDDDDNLRRITTDSPFVEGDFEIIATPAAGRVEVVLLVTGSTWVEVNTRYRAAREWWRQSGSFHLDVTVDGNAIRYLARRPDVTTAPLETGNVTALDRSYLLTFPVQPNPVVL